MLKGGEIVRRGQLVTGGIGEEEEQARGSFPLVGDRRFQPTRQLSEGGRLAAGSNWELKGNRNNSAVGSDSLNAAMASALCPRQAVKRGAELWSKFTSRRITTFFIH